MSQQQPQPQICLRCRLAKTSFPHPRNRLTCGPCLHELHENWRDAEDFMSENKIARGV